MRYLGLAAILLFFACAFSFSTEKEKIKHGDYLVNRASMCVDCHTPRDENNKFDMTKQMQGASMGPPSATPNPNRPSFSPNITSIGLAGQWGKKAIIDFLMTGNTPPGVPAPRPPMPGFRFNKDDAGALYAYLMSLPPKPKSN